MNWTHVEGNSLNCLPPEHTAVLAWWAGLPVVAYVDTSFQWIDKSRGAVIKGVTHWTPIEPPK